MATNNPYPIKRQLMQVAKRENLDFDKAINLYVREGILDRLSKSQLGNQFVLKGASVFQILEGKSHRPTADIDLLGYGNNEPKKLKEIFAQICSLPLSDGLKFKEISTDILQKGQKYQGVRLKIRGNLENIPFTAQIDVGYGHIITPSPQKAEFPTLLARNPPKLQVYPVETIVAEKLEALVSLGLRNSRLKDYYDLLYLARNVTFEGKILTLAITNTFHRRETNLSSQIPDGLTEKYLEYRPQRNKEWKKLYSQGIMGARPQFIEAIAQIREFVLPPLQAAAHNESFDKYWSASGKWQELNLYQIYSQDLKELGLERSQKIALFALSEGMAPTEVSKMLKNYDPPYQDLVKKAGDKKADQIVISSAQIKLFESLSQNSQLSTETKVSKNKSPKRT